MKKLLLIIIAVIGIQTAQAQQLDQKTINIIKVKMINAESLYSKGEYYDALQKVKGIEAMTKGNKSAKLQNLKVKCYVGLGLYSIAESELDKLYNMNPSDEILTDIASYSDLIERNVAEQKRKEANRGSFTDNRDGKVYKSIKIGNQTWMAENLNYKTENSWCYNNDPANCRLYGLLYNWKAALAACPEGWHLPDDEDWKILETQLGMSRSETDQKGRRGNVSKKIKSVNGWRNSGGGNNSTEFNALPGGYSNSIKDFRSIGLNSDWWTSSLNTGTSAWGREVSYNDNHILRASYKTETTASVRCLKN